MSGSSKCYVVAVFGTGRIGRVHLNNLVQNRRVKIKWVVEKDVQFANAVLGDLSHLIKDDVTVVGFENAAKVYDDPQVDFVVICTPSFMHEDIAVNSLKAGKAVFCEKPLAPTLDAVKRIYEAVEKYQKPLFCAFQRRFDPQLRHIYERVQGGELGQIRTIRSTSRDPPAMITKEYLMLSGGIFVDAAVHDIDMVCWMAGEKPQTVYATGHVIDPMVAECNDIDMCNITLKFPGGAVGNIEMARNTPIGYDQRVEVLGEKGLLKSINKRPIDVETWNMSGSRKEVIFEDFCKRYAEGYVLEMEHFLNVLDGKEVMGVTGTSTIMVSTISRACKESYKTGKVICLADYEKSMTEIGSNGSEPEN